MHLVLCQWTIIEYLQNDSQIHKLEMLNQQRKKEFLQNPSISDVIHLSGFSQICISPFFCFPYFTFSVLPNYFVTPYLQGRIKSKSDSESHGCFLSYCWIPFCNRVEGRDYRVICRSLTCTKADFTQLWTLSGIRGSTFLPRAQKYILITKDFLSALIFLSSSYLSSPQFSTSLFLSSDCVLLCPQKLFHVSAHLCSVAPACGQVWTLRHARQLAVVNSSMKEKLISVEYEPTHCS